MLSVWRFRHLMVAAIRGDFSVRFARSRLGLAWSILHPLAMAAIFALVLGELLGARLDGSAAKAAYPVYLLAGMSAWSLFFEIVDRCLKVFVEKAGLMKKIAFPRLCLPLIVLGTALLNHALALIAVAVAAVLLGHWPNPAWLALPLGAVPLCALALGVGVILGILNVYSRDVAQVTLVGLQLWFWLTPIVYVAQALPPSMAWLATLNPIVPLIKVYQDAFVHATAPSISGLLPSVGLAGVSLLAGLWLFRRASADLVDAL